MVIESIVEAFFERCISFSGEERKTAGG